MTMKRLSELVEDSFGWLLDEFGFTLIHEESYPQDYGNSIVVLESSECRLRIVLERGQVFVEVGPLHAPLDWATQAPGLWFDITDVIPFMTHEDIEWQYPLRDGDPAISSSPMDQMKGISTALRPFMRNTIHLLSPGVFEDRQMELIQFRKRRTAEWLTSLYHEYHGGVCSP